MESTQATSKRRWFQIHLSTCVVLMIMAGAVVWMNCVKTSVYIPGGEYRDIYGWPVPMVTLEREVRIFEDYRGNGRALQDYTGRTLYNWDMSNGVAINALTLLSLLLVTALFCEWFSRRREVLAENGIRPWLPVCAVTAIVSTIVVFGALIANLTERREQSATVELVVVKKGWPFVYFIDWPRENVDGEVAVLEEWFGRHEGWSVHDLWVERDKEKYEHGVAYNAITICALVVALGFLSERLVARKIKQ